ncbi:hypothetical protein BV898_13579 [Hypsibius exemplaris]|uniref:Uncharacterized protein n=1 Tax=Hypsibius exemplaris TaxID=2072580 RepID=A0A1W0WAG6_HYPEX|nr:hypothetical protein BV898_13579 [Hypsibius exemplaris]
MDIAEDMFEGYTGLRELVLADCRIYLIHPGSLSSLALPGQPAVLTDLSILNNEFLIDFSWEILRPVADSVQVSTIPQSEKKVDDRKGL